MPSEAAANAESVAPDVRLIEMGTAAWVTMIIHGAAKIGLVDHFDGGAKTAEQLAEPTGTHAPSLRRLMRTLAGLGILTEGPAGHFALTSLGAALKRDAPGAARATILTLAGGRLWRTMGEFPYSLETGKPGHTKTHDKPLFEWLAQRPEEAALFSGWPGADGQGVSGASRKSRFSLGACRANRIGRQCGRSSIGLTDISGGEHARG